MKKALYFAGGFFTAVVLFLLATVPVFEGESEGNTSSADLVARSSDATKDQLDRIEYAMHGDPYLRNGTTVKSSFHREAYWVVVRSWDATDEKRKKTVWLVSGSKLNPIQAHPAGPTAQIHSSETYLRNTEKWSDEMARVVEQLRSDPSF